MSRGLRLALMNALLGQKLSIPSRKPQTTRHCLRGILTTETAQFILVDTPGFQTRHRSTLNRVMNRSVRGALEAVDVAVLGVETKRLPAEDRALVEQGPPPGPLVPVLDQNHTVHAAIVGEKEGHKAILLGWGGRKMKQIATAARKDMETLFGGKVYLEVWVKVRGGWTNDEAALKQMGYG